jgi:transposase, IS5 family
MAKLDNTSQTVVAIAFLVMNLVAGLRKLLWLFLRQFLLLATPLAPKIIKNYVSASSSKEKLNLLVGEQ